MKVKNKIFVFALILSLISTVGTVVAADDITFVQSELETVSDENGMKLNENDDFGEVYKKAKDFVPKKFESNAHNMISLVDKFITEQFDRGNGIEK